MFRPVACVGVLCLVMATWLRVDGQAAQLGALVSPGPLARAHASLEGAANCAKCHETGRKVTARRCLECHQPIADRMARKVGVHRAVTTDCVTCHVEHAGVDGELRRLNERTFNHAAETGFPLDGLHAKTAARCAACHKTRSFLAARAACASCHADVHKGTLGNECAKCHTTAVPFTSRPPLFDHARARFTLTGAHETVACQKCHKNKVFRGLEFATCAACHDDPHRAKMGPTCTTCHTTAAWSTRTIDHAKTAFPLAGAHAQVACTKCHTSSRLTADLRFDTCSACHVNVHRESIKEDCRSCHTEASFHTAKPFDHDRRARFALTGKHATLTCRQCHTRVSPPDVPLERAVVDFGGATPACASCHKDPHKGEFGATCQVCHTAATFNARAFVHPRAPEFFAGQHAGLACARCHLPAKTLQPAHVAGLRATSVSSPPAMACTACHTDVHLGQVGPTCDRCHTVNAAKFAAANFVHSSTAFPLTGKHAALECVKCHPSVTGAFPGGTGTAVALKPRPTDCRGCHADQHLGQLDVRCQACHATDTFHLATFTHVGMERFFSGSHGRLPCASCHKKQTGVFPAGNGTTVLYRVGRTCKDCHPQF